MLEIMNVQTVMRSALHCAAKEIAEEAYVNPLVIRGKLEKHIVEHVGETWLDHSVISGGSDGIDCRKSMAWGSTGIMDLSLIYKVEVPSFNVSYPCNCTGRIYAGERVEWLCRKWIWKSK